MNDELAEITGMLPAAVIDRLRGSQSRAGWLEQAALELARRQSGLDPLEPVGWWDLRGGLMAARCCLVHPMSDKIFYGKPAPMG